MKLNKEILQNMFDVVVTESKDIVDGDECLVVTLKSKCTEDILATLYVFSGKVFFVKHDFTEINYFNRPQLLSLMSLVGLPYFE